MSDNELISKVAEMWISNGGDSDGFSWCYIRILEKIKNMEGDKNE